MKWKCSLCNTAASSKCVDFRGVFIESPEGMTDISHMLIEATTLLQWKEHPTSKKKYIECSIDALNLKTLTNILSELSKHPTVLNELLCDHEWCLVNANDCELSCNAHRKIGEAQRKRPLPSEKDVMDDLPQYEDLCKRAKIQLVEDEKRAKAIRAIKQLFTTHVKDKPWDESAVIIKNHDDQYGKYSYTYDYSGVSINYFSRITYGLDDCDTFTDALVKINGTIVYQEVKDDVLIDKSKSAVPTEDDPIL